MRRAAILSATIVGLAAPCALADLPSVSSGHRPGPDILYADPPGSVPQLENAAPWTAAPILVSGASAYRSGEFLYQDFLYDDKGALGAKDPRDPFDEVGSFLFSPKTGTLTYPTDPVFANNAADLVELRVRPLADATAFRVTLNSLQDPARTAFTIALGTSDGPRAWPAGAGVSSPAELFLTVHGTTAELVDAEGGAPRSPAPTATVDVRRRQFDVRVPRAAWDPAGAKLRMAAGVGLWDTAANAYAKPAAEASETAPGGASPAGAALFNLAFRFAEPVPDVDRTGAGATIADAAVGAKVEAYWWRENAQAVALATGDVSGFFAEVDFAKLASGVTDDSGVPRTGYMNRILASRFVFGQGIDHSIVCFDVTDGSKVPNPCTGRFLGQLQPYALYVPAKPAPAEGYGLTLLLHSLSANYNQYTNSKNQSQLGERGPGSLVATPAGRGPDGFYEDVAEADAFEVWADVARHYDVDGDWAAVSGYSMGAFGTYRLLARYPDLFGRGFSVVGAPGSVEDQMPSLRNTPLMAWSAVADELVSLESTEAAIEQMDALGLRFVADLFTADHLTLATNDEYGPGAEFLGEHRADRSPPHVTFVYDPAEDSARSGLVADHAYWVSGLRPRDPKAEKKPMIDAVSAGFGVGEPPVLDVQQGAGAMPGGSRGPLPYARRAQDWGPQPAAARADRLTVRAENLAAATIDARRAKLSCAPTLAVTSDGPFDLSIACPPAGTGAGCTGVLRIKLPRMRGQRITRVTVLRKGKALKRTRGRNLRRVSVRRPVVGAFALRIRARTNRGRTVSVTRRYAACAR